MKKTYIMIIAAALLAAGCAKTSSTGVNDSNKRYFDAWIEMNNPGTWEKTELGSYIISKTTGDPSKPAGKTTDKDQFVALRYTISNLSGEITSTTEEEVAKQIRVWSKSNYYGPAISKRTQGVMFVGVSELIDQMNIGGSVKAVIPGWLMGTKVYDDAQSYIDNVSGTPAIYEFTLCDVFDSTIDYEKAQIADVMGLSVDGLSEFKIDEDLDGLYYKQINASDEPEHTYSASDKVYLNYICRRIDGTGVDTNIADSAKVYGTYKSGSSYSPLLINWAETYDKMTMTSSESKMIAGFARAIFEMKPHEKGRAFMISNYAYEDSGSGSKIPGYCPLIFELEIVDAPKK